jgi:hypothetical protein
MEAQSLKCCHCITGFDVSAEQTVLRQAETVSLFHLIV